MGGKLKGTRVGIIHSAAGIAGAICFTLFAAAIECRAEERAQSARNGAKEKVLRHAVFFKFRESSSNEDVQSVVDAFRALPGKIAGIEEFQFGTELGRSKRNDGYTHCFLLTFKDEAGRAAYLPHPEHEAFGASLRPHLEKVFVFDYWGEKPPRRSAKELKHAVFLKFKPGIGAEEVRKLEQGLAELPSKIEAIKAFEWGTNNSPEKHDQGFTHCFMFTFGSEDGLQQYIDDPAHTAVASELLPKVEQVRVLDFWVERAAAAAAD